MTQKTITIDPKDMSRSAWEELANAAAAGLDLIDSDPQPFTATLEQIDATIAAVEVRAQEVEDLYDDEPQWAADLREALAVLERAAEQLDTRTVAVPLRLLRTITATGCQDIYTDAREYSDRVEQMSQAVYRLGLLLPNERTPQPEADPRMSEPCGYCGKDFSDCKCHRLDDGTGACVDCGTQCVADADGASVLCPVCDAPEPEAE